MKFACVNRAGQLDRSAFFALVAACEEQLNLDVAPVWTPGQEHSIDAYDLESEIPDDSLVIVRFLDALPTFAAAVYGIHLKDEAGRPLAMIDVGESFAMGGSATSGTSAVSVSASHELGETAIDPDLTQYRPGPGGRWALEPFDPPEQITYVRRGVWVSDFVTPAFYFEASVGPYSHTGQVEGPHVIPTGGSAVVWRDDGSATRWPAMGQRTRPSKAHPASRSSRRLRSINVPRAPQDMQI